MTTVFRLGLALTAATLLVAVPSEGLTIQFADPAALSPNGTPDACFNGDDVCGPTLSWTLSGITVTASPLGSASAIIQDLFPNRGGLGAVNHLASGGYADPRGDAVNRGQGIRLTFSEPVHLRRVRFRNENHGGGFGDDDDDDDDDNATFRFRSDDGAFHSRELRRVVGFGGLLGTSFDFRYGGSDPESFYIARVRFRPEVEVPEPEPIPEPGTMTLLGAGLLGLVGRARRRMRPGRPL